MNHNNSIEAQAMGLNQLAQQQGAQSYFGVGRITGFPVGGFLGSGRASYCITVLETMQSEVDRWLSDWDKPATKVE